MQTNLTSYTCKIVTDSAKMGRKIVILYQIYYFDTILEIIRVSSFLCYAAYKNLLSRLKDISSLTTPSWSTV